MVNRVDQNRYDELMPSSDDSVAHVQRSSRSKTMNVLTMWDRGITNASVRIGDAVVAGVRTFASELIHPSRSSKKHLPL